MPDLSRYMIKTSLVYLAGALLVGIALTPPVVAQMPAVAAVQPGYVHLFVVGWLSQLIFGVAYWLFPRHSRAAPYGNQRLPVLGFVSLNIGLVLRLVCEPAQVWHPGMWWRWGLWFAAVLQWLAGMLFAVYLWQRVRTR